jgi:hypothetical protein
MKIYNKQLEEEVQKALAWDYPDKESIGYTPADFLKVIKHLKNYILVLEYYSNPEVLKKINRSSKFDDL